jgi:hypothetical protein
MPAEVRGLPTVTRRVSDLLRWSPLVLVGLLRALPSANTNLEASRPRSRPDSQLLLRSGRRAEQQSTRRCSDGDNDEAAAYATAAEADDPDRRTSSWVGVLALMSTNRSRQPRAAARPARKRQERQQDARLAATQIVADGPGVPKGDLVVSVCREESKLLGLRNLLVAGSAELIGKCRRDRTSRSKTIIEPWQRAVARSTIGHGSTREMRITRPAGSRREFMTKSLTTTFISS